MPLSFKDGYFFLDFVVEFGLSGHKTHTIVIFADGNFKAIEATYDSEHYAISGGLIWFAAHDKIKSDYR